MPASILEIKERLVRVIDDNGTVKDMGIAAEAITILERTAVTKEDLERTRLGLYVNNIRKAAKNSPLAKRAKNLVKSWRQMIEQGSRQCPPVQVQGRLRPETPNSVGSSPSPPEPNEYAVRNYASTRTPIAPPKVPSTTPTDVARKTKKRKDISESSKINRKKDVPDGSMTIKGHSSEVKPPDTGQPLMSVGTNGLKLTFKTRPGLKESTNQNEDEEIDVVNVGNSKPVILERSQTTELTTTPQKDRKSRKRKKGHKGPPETPPSALTSSVTERLPRQDDIYNNNKNEKKLVTSQSTPNFTVQKTPTKHKSPDKVSPRNNAILTTPKSCNNLKNLPIGTTNFNLKRKREQIAVSTTSSPDSSIGEKPRGPKERRLTLTYDPSTGQLQQMPSDKSDNSCSDRDIKKTPDKTKMKVTNFKNGNGTPAKESVKTVNKKKESSPKIKITEKIKPPPKIEKIFKEKKIEEKVESDEIPTRLSPSVQIMGEFSGTLASNCNGGCFGNFYETRRQFRKRKTRRKDNAAFEMSSMFPISNLVETTDSDSDENSASENNFCSSIKLDKNSITNEPSHSRNCKWPGVTGCRGNNGSWYDWLETFSINAHVKSEPLPEETEILPLQILPYVELD